MQKKRNSPAEAAELRRGAEERLRARNPEPDPARLDAEARRLAHELQVHRIELEMQNEELQRAGEGLEKYSDHYDFAPVGCLTLDREGKILEANLTAASLLGIERSRLVRRRFGLCLAPADRPAFPAFLNRVFAGEGRESCDVAILKNGATPVEVRMEAAVAASKRECRVAVTDVTHQKKAEEDRLILSKLESTRVLADGIAHDFNNLLTAMLLNLELAAQLIPAGKELAEHLEQVKQAVLTSRDLTGQLLTFASGGAPIRKRIRVSELIPHAAGLALSGSAVQCDFSLAENLFLVEADAGQLGQVIRNLVLNGREAVAEGGVISIRAENVVLGAKEIPSLPPGDYVHVSVADRGAGMSKAVLARIFDPYFSTKLRGAQKGMGLGLTICHAVVQQHGGAIAAESKPGMGSTFHIHLPAARTSPPMEQASAGSGPPQPGRVLVMEEEAGLRNLLEKLLQQLGHETVLVSDGKKAVEAYRIAQRLGRNFDAVLLDLTVRGGTGGLEAFRKLIQIDPAAKAIVMSGYSSNPVVLEPQRHGFAGVLMKPFGKDKLREILSRVMAPGTAGNAQATRNP